MIDSEVFVSLFGTERGEQLAAMKPQEVFVASVNGLKFEVFGISETLRRQADYRKYTTLLQVISASPVLIEAFLQQGYTLGKFVEQIMTALDINKAKLKGGPKDQKQQPQQQSMQQPGGAPGASPDMMSQVPMASGQPAGGGLSQAFSGQGNSMNMPANSGY